MAVISTTCIGFELVFRPRSDAPDNENGQSVEQMSIFVIVISLVDLLCMDLANSAPFSYMHMRVSFMKGTKGTLVEMVEFVVSYDLLSMRLMKEKAICDKNILLTRGWKAPSQSFRRSGLSRYHRIFEY